MCIPCWKQIQRVGINYAPATPSTPTMDQPYIVEEYDVTLKLFVLYVVNTDSPHHVVFTEHVVSTQQPKESPVDY